MPARAVFAAATDVGHHQHAAVPVPGCAEAARVPGLHRLLEAAVAIKQGRVGAVGADAWRPDHEVGHARAVLRRREALLDFHVLAVEELRTRLQGLARVAAGAAEQQRVGREEVGVGQEVRLGQCVLGQQRVVQRLHTQGAGEGRGHRALDPACANRPPLFDAPGHVVEHRQQHLALGRREAGQRARGAGCEQRGEVAFAAQVGRGVGHQQRAFGPDALADLPVAAQLQQQSLAPETFAGVAGAIERHCLAALQQCDLGVVEIGGATEQRALEARRAVDLGVHRDVLRPALVHRRGSRQRLAALPALDDARVARFGH